MSNISFQFIAINFEPDLRIAIHEIKLVILGQPRVVS